MLGKLIRVIAPCLVWCSCFATNNNPVYHHPENFLHALAGKNSAVVGAAIYQQFCATCHAKQPSINMGAPRSGVSGDWQQRQKLRTPQQMLKKIDEGMNAMPPRGGCFECTDEQLLAAINFMLPKIKGK